MCISGDVWLSLFCGWHLPPWLSCSFFPISSFFLARSLPFPCFCMLFYFLFLSFLSPSLPGCCRRPILQEKRQICCQFFGLTYCIYNSILPATKMPHTEFTYTVASCVRAFLASSISLFYIIPISIAYFHYFIMALHFFYCTFCNSQSIRHPMFVYLQLLCFFSNYSLLLYSIQISPLSYSLCHICNECRSFISANLMLIFRYSCAIY